jgi:hypothetical protein
VHTNICPNDGDLVTPSPTVNIDDALYALRLAAGIIPPTASDFIHGDVAPCVNGLSQPDGIIDMGDVVVILRKAVGLATCI